MSIKFFDRQYRLKAGVAGSVGFEVGQPSSDTNKALHINFSLERTDSSTLNTAKIQIWNLNQAHLNTLARTNCQIELNAGYGDSRPCIFKGTVSNVQTDLDGADRMTDIEAIDGFAETKDTFVSISYRGKTAVKTVIDDAAKKMGLPVRYSSKARSVALRRFFSRGYSYVGAAKNALDAACRLASIAWTIQNGTLQVTQKNEPISTIAQVLDKTSGLIGIPKKIYNSAVAAGEDTGSTLQDSLFGYEVVFFLNGAINVNDLVKLQSEVVTGIFRVYKLTIQGDNLEGDWQCTAQLVEVGSV